ncbi:MAG: glycoside hydrolase [Alkalispirochaeta sp.]
MDTRFLSVALDYACLIGAPWWEGTRRTRRGFGHEIASPADLGDRRLIHYARALTPGFLRLGGSEADRIFYAFSNSGPPRGRRSETVFRSVLTRERWDQVGALARESGLELFVTVNAGAGPRDRKGRWDPTNAEELLTYTADRRYPVSVWEFGNEVNGFPFLHGPGSHLTAGRYAADFTTFHDMVRHYAPRALTAGPASAYWPMVGEILPLLPRLATRLQRVPDIVTWHYYPQQSSRGLIATRRADAVKVLMPHRLDSAAYWARRVMRHARSVGRAGGRSQPAPEVWLGETGHALYGGEPGVSDRFIAGLWWLDQLGLMARSGVRVVVRQSLLGGDYALLDTETPAPRPDYWNSLLWKRLMGESVYAVVHDGDPLLRVYAHNTPQQPESITMLLINLNHHAEISVSVDTATLGFTPREFEIYAVTAEDPYAWSISINGRPPELPEQTQPPAGRRTPPGKSVPHNPREPIVVPPLSYTFVVAVAHT